MKRIMAALAILALAWSSSALWLGVAAAPTLLHRAEAEAVAVHGFYDHENLVPVPLFNLSVPYAMARYEPGPSSEALGSFLWEREAANLGNIMCALSGNEFCDLPPYPFQARASHPSSGGDGDPPTLTIDEEGAPVAVRAAHEDASASEDGSAAEADVKRLEAVPMTGDQAAAAEGLAAALSAVTGEPVRASPWLVAVRTASSESVTRVTGPAVVARGTSAVHGLELLGGLIRVEAVRGRVAVTTAGGGDGEAKNLVAGIDVGGIRAEVTGRGLRIADRRLDDAELAAATEALEAALAKTGLRIARGERRVRTRGGFVSAEASALELSFRRQVLPDQFPEGTTGDDVVHIPVGWARASASTTETSSGETDSAAPPPAPISGEVSSGGVPASGGAVPSAPAVAAPDAEEAPVAPATAPVSYPIAMGIPPGALVAVVGAAVALLVGLTWLKVVEVLAE